MGSDQMQIFSRKQTGRRPCSYDPEDPYERRESEGKGVTVTYGESALDGKAQILKRVQRTGG